MGQVIRIPIRWFVFIGGLLGSSWFRLHKMPQCCFLETPSSLYRLGIPTADVETRMPEGTLEFQRLEKVAAVLSSLPTQHVSVEHNHILTASSGSSHSFLLHYCNLQRTEETGKAVASPFYPVFLRKCSSGWAFHTCTCKRLKARVKNLPFLSLWAALSLCCAGNLPFKIGSIPLWSTVF